MATRTRRRELQRAFVTTAAVASAALLPACGGSVDVQPTPVEATCPDTQPAEGTACEAPMECQYNDGCGASVVCVAGAWLDMTPPCNPPFPEPCPAEAPQLGSSCYEPYQSCLYPNWDECGQDLNVTCNGGVWEADGISSCNPPPPCPAEVPANGSICDFPVLCDYTIDSECGLIPATASCDGATWTVDSTIICNPPEPDPCTYLATVGDCAADPSCRWLTPGCGMPALPQAGCFPAQDCTDDSCPPTKSCQVASTDCETCQTCDIPVLVCLPG